MPDVVAICQPNFLPWLGFMEMAARADLFVMLDDAQYVRREWGNRNRVLDGRGGWQWLTVPVKRHPQKTPFNEIEVSYETPWAETMVRTLRHVYGRSPHFERYGAAWTGLLERGWDRLVDLNVATIELLAEQLGIACRLELASAIVGEGRRDGRLAAICEKVGAAVYLANNGSAGYIEPGKFLERGVGFVFQDYEHPEYKQTGPDFVSHMSAVDVVFWHGPDARDIVLSGCPADWRSAIKGPSYLSQPQ